jgi:hypothetical protein
MYICRHCAAPIYSRRRNAIYCSRDCQHEATHNTARTKKRENDLVPFIAIDGESRPHENTNKYHILSCGDATLYRGGDALTFPDICSFLYEQFELNPHASYVGFYLEYDFTYWLRTLPAERAKMLFHPEQRARTRSGNNRIPFPVEYLGWEFDLLGMKRFRLRPEGAKSWMYICDVGPFFQTSFLKALDPSKWPTPVCTQEEYNIIVEGKNARGQETQTDEEMIRYNLLENALLVRLMDRMREGYKQMHIKIPSRNWYGPGAAVNVWLNNINAPVAPKRETSIEDALRASYYGGRFEITAHGPVGTLYEYDINSAYPDAMSELPMENGTWLYNDGNLMNDYCLVHAVVTCKSKWLGAVPHREPSGKCVCYPHKVYGWYWAHELIAADKAGLIGDITWHESYRYVPGTDYKPFAELRTLYDVRVQVGKDTPQGKAIKLVYNSGYGKVAQSVGQPKFGNVLYASLITSHCRTKILNAIASHPKGAKAVAMIATDGIYFTSPHDGLPLSSTELGKWAHSKREEMFLIKPGMYFDGDGKVKSRGIGNRELNRSRDLIRKTWAEWDGKPEWPKFEVTPDFLVISPRAASHRGAWNTCGTVSTEPLTHSFNPRTKRYFEYPLTPIKGVVRTTIMPFSRAAMKQRLEYVESTPYDKRFGVAMMEPGDAALSGLISKTEGETIPMI